MTQNIPPQGDGFEDQYTSATADLSAGGVAAAREQPTLLTDTSVRSEPWQNPTTARQGAETDPVAAGRMLPEPSRGLSLTEPRTIGLGGGLLIAMIGGAAGAWLYGRRQRERSTPIYRFRRGVDDVRVRLNQTQLPEGAAPMSGGALAIVISSLVLARALRRESPQTQARDKSQEMLADLLQIAKQRGQRMSWSDLPNRGQARDLMNDRRDRARRAFEALQGQYGDVEPKTAGGIGIGAIAGIAAVGYLLLRALRGGGHSHATSPYMAERVSE